MAAGLTPIELAQIRADLGELMPDTCYILSNSGTIDAVGSPVESWGTAGTASCRLDFGNAGSEKVSGGEIVPFQVGVLTVPYTTTITTNSRVSHNSIQYNVTAVNDDNSWLGCKQATLTRIPARSA